MRGLLTHYQTSLFPAGGKGKEEKKERGEGLGIAGFVISTPFS